MARKPSLLQLYHIAHAYYMENKDQDTIAASIGLSRSQVSRLLDQARKAGMVKFEVNFPSDIDAEALAESLRDELGLQAVRIAPRSVREDDPPVVLASFAATVMPDLLVVPGDVGVGWGRTVYDFALRLRMHGTSVARRIIPLVGSAGQQAPWLQVNSIVDRLAEKLEAERVFIRMQAFIETGGHPPSRLEKENLNHLASLWKVVETAIIGLGMPADQATYLQTEIDHSVLVRLQKAGAVGDILGR
jgi:deoxyribonucleoside regulator